ncbi:MAG: PspC domain-containing protein [Prevotellaceae bacterium]|jgi:phage shock protein PspC (stress-responsive transcriptional regulator)|nr:PspC domain-containing protein [Prevotellaceae bacterium]
MKTTLQVSLNGIAFNLDENAYQQLKSYINELQSHFPDNDEIIEDIEARIADLLSLRIKSTDQAVNIRDVNEIIGTIGKPGDIDDDINSSDKFKKHFENAGNPTKKRLYRDTDNKVIAGVCSGIGHYLNLDATWIRIVFIIFMAISLRIDGLHFWFSSRFIFGMPFILFVYIVLWIVTPRTKTPRQTLEMHGYTSARQTDNTSKSRKNGFGNFIKKFFRLIIQICVGISLSLAAIICFVLLVAGIVGFFGGSLFGGTNFISLLDYIHTGEVSTWIIKLIIAILIFIPVCILLYLSVKVLAGFKIKDKPAMIILSAVWIIAAMFAAGNTVSVVKLYRYDSTVHEIRKDVNFQNIKTLNIKIPDNLRPYEIAFADLGNAPLYEDISGKSLFICPEVHIRHVDSIPENYIEVRKTARASTRYEAQAKAQSIPNGYIVNDSATITLVPMEFNKYKKWSSEMIDIYIYLPDSVNITGINRFVFP